MISHFINEPDHWRARSEEARNLANQMNDPESKDAMLRIADDYERLAPITDGPRAKAPRFRLPPFADAMAQTLGAVRVWKRASAREGRPLSDCWSGAGQY